MSELHELEAETSFVRDGGSTTATGGSAVNRLPRARVNERRRSRVVVHEVWHTVLREMDAGYVG